MSEMVPKIRFSSFTDDWEQRKLGDIMNVTSVKRIHQSDWTDSGIRFLRARDIVAAFKNEKQTEYLYISIEKYKEYSKISGKVSPGDLLVTGVGSIGVPMLVTDEEPIYFKDGNIIWFKNESKIEGYFFYYSFINNKIQKYIRDVAGTGTVGTYTIDSGKKTPIVLPNYEEQAKIGSFFKRLDDLITLHQRKLDLLKEQKKGFLQKMFPKNGSRVPELRFSGFADDWEERNLGDVTTWTKGQGLTKEDLNEERDGSEAVHYADLYKFSPVMHNVIHWTNSDDGRIIPDNSLLFPASDVTPVGLARASTLRLSGVKAGGDVIIGQLDESINSSFMSYQINANSKKILPLITGTTVKHVQAKSLATVSVSITNMAEQTAIAGIFERIDNLIALHQRKLELLKEQKKGFLQKMFVS